MTTAAYILMSALPALLWIARMMALRNIPAGAKLLIDLALFIVSLPIGLESIGWLLDFPADAGDHSPGLGIAFMLLLLVWLVCMAAWFARGGVFISRWLAARAR